MASPPETVLTLVVIKAAAIVGSALTTVFVLALFGAKRKEFPVRAHIVCGAWRSKPYESPPSRARLAEALRPKLAAR